MSAKLPESVLVVIHTPALDVLLLERARRAGFWQSVTGSLERLDEPLPYAARREVLEETGIDAAPARFVDWRLANAFQIYAHWRGRFPVGTTHNTEHVFSLSVPAPLAVRLAPLEHRAQRWLPWRDAAAACFSWSNRDAIAMLPARCARA
ncbi:MAG: dihydroneopterin triphosphate diphosphatase [Betaproteobacteria bacterium]|nr:dihydroneopterin triphosphate diphosphatase [Betaproteobacteria bacterium]MDH4322953.1 dihydroneopterin triphosphate diphosphatase [Betaproteobacteria bacterium]